MSYSHLKQMMILASDINMEFILSYQTAWNSLRHTLMKSISFALILSLCKRSNNHVQIMNSIASHNLTFRYSSFRDDTSILHKALISYVVNFPKWSSEMLFAANKDYEDFGAILEPERKHYMDDEFVKMFSAILFLHILLTYIYIVYLYDIISELVS